MIVTFITDHPCPQCGHHNHGAITASVRVNKATLRSTGPTIGAAPPHCTECRAPLAGQPDRTVLDPEDAARVTSTRARRGWTTT